MRAAAGPARLAALREGAPRGGAALVLAASGESALALGGDGFAVHLVEGAPGAAAVYALKRAALVALPPQSRAGLFGLDAAGRRLWFYHFVRERLEPAAAAYWDAREALLREGLADAGAEEQAWAAWRRARAGAAGRLLRRIDRAAGGAGARAWGLPPESAAARWLGTGAGEFGLGSLEATAAPPAPTPLGLDPSAALAAGLPPLSVVDLGDWLDRAPAAAAAGLWAPLRAALAPGARVALWSADRPPACPEGMRVVAAGPDPDAPAPAGWAVLARA